MQLIFFYLLGIFLSLIFDDLHFFGLGHLLFVFVILNNNLRIENNTCQATFRYVCYIFFIYYLASFDGHKKLLFGLILNFRIKTLEAHSFFHWMICRNFCIIPFTFANKKLDALQHGHLVNRLTVLLVMFVTDHQTRLFLDCAWQPFGLDFTPTHPSICLGLWDMLNMPQILFQLATLLHLIPLQKWKKLNGCV